MKKEYDIIDSIETKSGFAIILNNEDFMTLIKEQNLLIFNNKIASVKFTIYNGAVIGTRY